MKTHSTYECEICGSTFKTDTEALACEAQGFPEPMPFLEWDYPIPAFGPQGVIYLNLGVVSVVRAYMKHEWAVTCTTPVTLGLTDFGDLLPARLFDPRYGWDTFRYGGTRHDLSIWAETLKVYGFTATDVDPYTKVAIDRVQHRILGNAMRAEIAQRLREQAQERFATPVALLVAQALLEHSNLVPVSNLVRHKLPAPTEAG
jgi:hypothetical protein